MPIEEVRDLADARLDDYRNLPDRALLSGGRFVAESEMVVRKLLGSRLLVHSALLTPPRLDALAALLPPDLPVFVAPQDVFDAIAGFHVHRGCLAIASRPHAPVFPTNARTVVVLEDLVDVDNLGAMARNAAALGADAMMLSPRSADPFYRKAVRVSVGSVFFLPIVRATSWPGDLTALRAQGFRLCAAVVDPNATPLPRYRRPDKLAVVFGSEGPGLSSGALAACDDRITIPMGSGADSLNVATAGAIVLHALREAPV